MNIVIGADYFELSDYNNVRETVGLNEIQGVYKRTP